MDAIVDVVAQVLLLGSLALLVWGAMLTAGQLVRAAQARSAAEDAGSRGEDRRRSPRAGFASVRRRRFSRLAPPA
jgi:thiazole synthase ThiGH ThiG subunit